MMFRWLHDGQEYRCVGLEPFTRRDGSAVRLFAWRSECPTCGKPFECRTIEGAKFTPTRRCDECTRPGLTVRRERKQREFA
jgi:hypothetical protein